MTRIAGWLRGLEGWRRLLLAFVLGAISALAQAPHDLLPLLLVAFPGLLLLLEGCLAARRPLRAAFWTGWAFGFGACGLGMYWIGFAFLVQADQFAWMIPIIVPGLMAFLAIYAGLAGWAAVLAWRVGPWGDAPLLRLLSLAGAWSLFEVLRGHLLTGFPWNVVSQSATAWLPLAQGAAWIGPYGLSLVMVALAGLPAVAAAGRRWPWPALAGALAVIFVLQLNVTGAPTLATGTATVHIVQPNVAQRDKLDPTKREANLARTLAMTEAVTARAAPGSAYVVWPENTYPFLSEQPSVGRGVAAASGEGATLITGSVRAYLDGASDTDYRFGNAVQVFGPATAGEAPLSAVYDKHHLVPFGEYLPLEGLFRATGLASMSPVGAGGFAPGPGPATLAIGPAPFAPLVCYEDVFPGELYPEDRRPDWLVVVTNDAWFGDGAGPAQHLAIARARAIESGLPLARSANTGISALIDHRGRVLDRLPLYEAGVITAALPPPGPRTLYERWGDLGWAILLLLVVLAPWSSGLAIRG